MRARKYLLVMVIAGVGLLAGCEESWLVGNGDYEGDYYWDGYWPIDPYYHQWGGQYRYGQYIPDHRYHRSYPYYRGPYSYAPYRGYRYCR